MNKPLIALALACAVTLSACGASTASSAAPAPTATASPAPTAEPTPEPTAAPPAAPDSFSAFALSAQQQVDYAADLDRNLGIANQLAHNPSLIELYTDSPDRLLLPAGVKILSREG